MPLHLITGHKGAAHITADDVGAFNAGTVGSGEYVLATGNQLKAELLSNNTVRILDGDLVCQGRHASLKSGTFEELTINNGEADKNRNDIIVARYTKDANTGIEDISFAVVQGEAVSGVASDPGLAYGDILSGNCLIDEMPLYRIRLEGLTASEPERLFRTIGSVGDGLLFRGWNPISSVDEDTPKKWRELGSGIWMIDWANILIDQPSQWGFLINVVCAEEVAQKFIVQASGETFRRNANGLGWYGNDYTEGKWAAVYDARMPHTVTGVYYGDYTAEKPTQFVNLGFTPSAVMVRDFDMNPADGYSGFSLKGHNATNLVIVENGFEVSGGSSQGRHQYNLNGEKYPFIAWR